MDSTPQILHMKHGFGLPRLPRRGEPGTRPIGSGSQTARTAPRLFDRPAPPKLLPPPKINSGHRTCRGPRFTPRQVPLVENPGITEQSTASYARRLENWIEKELDKLTQHGYGPADATARLVVHRQAFDQLVAASSGFLRPLLKAIMEEYEGRLKELETKVTEANKLKQRVDAADLESRSVVERITKQRSGEQRQLQQAEQNVTRVVAQARKQMAQAEAEEKTDRQKIDELQLERHILLEQLTVVGKKTQELEQEELARRNELEQIEREMTLANATLEQLRIDCATAVPKDSHLTEIGKLDQTIETKAGRVDSLTASIEHKEELLRLLTSEIEGAAAEEAASKDPPNLVL